VIVGDQPTSPEGAEPEAPAEGAGEEFVVAKSIVVSRAAERDEESYRRSMPPVMSRSVLRSRWLEQQEGQKQRRSRTYAGRETRADEIIQPPYDLRALAQLLEDSPDFASVVEQLAVDVSGRGWDLVDAEDPLPEPGEPWPASPATIADQDRAITEERMRATAWLKALPRDFTGGKLSVQDLSKNAQVDYEALGEGYIEVAPEPGGDESAPIPAQLYHIQGQYVRKREDGTYVQLDVNGREAAFFRQFGSDPEAPSSRYTRDEAFKAGLDEEGEGALKNELFELRRYHPNELHYGLPLIVSALAAVRGNIFCDDRNVRYFINRAMPDWVVELKANKATINSTTNNLVDRYEEAIREHMEYVLKGDDYRTLILRVPTGEMETTWTKLTTEFEPAGLDAYQLRNRDVTIRVYRVPPHRLGIVETANLGSGSGESQDETYKHAQVDPRQERLEDFWDELLKRRGFRGLSFLYRDIDVTDEVREMQLYVMADATGALSVNEGRRWLSRMVKDQDFPDLDEDDADTPKYLLEARAAQTGGGLEGLFGSGGALPEREGAGALPSPAGGAGGLPAPAMQGTLAFDPGYARVRREMQSRMGRMRERRARLLEVAAGARRPAPKPENGDRAAAPEAIAP
jgi:capsid portal protein